MHAQNLSLHIPAVPGMGSKDQNIFSESSHAAYQIKWNGALSTMQAHIMFIHTPSTCWSSKKIILNVVILHIKLRGKTNRLT